MMNLYHYAFCGLCACLAGCNDNQDTMAVAASDKVMFEVSVTNETAGQPFSPMTLVAHDPAQMFWQVGQPVSVALERIAESGNAMLWRDALKANAMVYSTQEGKGLILPGKNETFMVSLSPAELASDSRLSLAMMLGKTNDGLVLMMGQKINTLKSGETTSVQLLSYDAGTELNRETTATLGALGGEGFSAVRDDRVDQLTLHPGVVSKDDGLASSGLTHLERWDNAVARVDIKRL